MGLKLPLTRVSFVALRENVHEVDQFIEKWIDVVDSVEIQKENSIDFYDDLLKKFGKIDCYLINIIVTNHGDKSLYMQMVKLTLL